MRHFSKGVLVGEPDPPPTTTIAEWARQERESAISKLNVKIEGPLQLTQNASLGGRISALTDLLHEIEKREP